MPDLPFARKILPALSAAVLATAALLLIAAGAHAATAPKIEDATVKQQGQDLVLTVRTAKPFALAGLEPRPDVRRAGTAYLCFGFAPAAGAGETRLCLGGPKGRKRVGVVTVDADGKPAGRATVAAKVRRPKPTKLVASLVAGPTHPTGLRPGHYQWVVLAASGGCQVRHECATQFPAEEAGAKAFRLRPVRAVGCTGGDAELVSSAETERKVVALTFDDGPSEYTERYLDVLREKDVRATFFEIGQEMPGREATMRRILAEGDELGDHTMNHVEYPGYGQIAGAAARIKAYTGFQPCLFRPPGGAQNQAVIDTAGSLGMKTIIWDVDPRDWSL
ncbi:MAG: polysaccharide deacetylase family protein, partial [Actinobacteria bacterium]|nr:polysaccharide deacetylase family protein [Actinomycetota bacterium]